MANNIGVAFFFFVQYILISNKYYVVGFQKKRINETVIQ